MDLFPAWFLVICQHLCPPNFNKGVVLPDLRKFEIGVTFIDEVEKGVDVCYFSPSPLHCERNYVNNVVT